MTHTIAEIKISYRPNKLGNGIKITDRNKAYQVLLENWDKGTIQLFEEFKILLLNNSNEVLGIYGMSKGSITGTIVDIRLMFATILKCGATSIITVHNHPSGKLKPSQADITIFKKITEVAKIHDINYLDNLIITSSGKYSFMDDGY